MGLLDYLSTHTFDEDYRTVAERRAAEESRRRAEQETRPDGAAVASGAGRPRWSRGFVAALVLLAFALLVVTAGTQTSREATALSDQRKDLIGQINDHTATLHHEQRRAERLQTDNRRLARQLSVRAATARRLLVRVRDLAVMAGSTRVRGPGVSIVVDDAPGAGSERGTVLDSDLQRLANGLWRAGAEAIAINGQRLGSLTAIRKAGSAITVNYHSLSRPYHVLAIGNPDTLPARFAETTDGQAWFDLQQQVGLRFVMRTRQSLTLPKAPTTLRYAHSVHEGGTS